METPWGYQKRDKGQLTGIMASSERLMAAESSLKPVFSGTRRG
ncbi:protein of unknown function [Vibrio tapetis subsp. tapetis]|uniref:Uncharacterized protein n=1 Tax=Vibrio tapetis subsp. tapetis TaxID=1671868 RepID=A0A2N8ZND0_9VIBR|nr:protein of unknown function [Vibrio tapetis subsp. tapetis]